MRVFVTGATGMIGVGVVKELRAGGHRVLGLARDEKAAKALREMGAEVHEGDLTRPDTLAAAARACDGVIHLGFVMDFSDLPGAFATDRRAIDAIGGALAESKRPFVHTTGTMLLPGGRVGTEDDAADPDSMAGVREPAERLALSYAERGVFVSIVRPAPTVHGPRDHHGFLPMLMANARQTGIARYVGDGANRWPAVHHDDAARVYVRAIETSAERARYHAVAEDAVPMRAIAEAIAARVGARARSTTREEAITTFGPFVGAAIAADNPVSSARTRERLAWTPREAGLLEDIAAAYAP